MHDLGLGPPVEVGTDEDANHSGSCNDSVYGCTRCYNHENNGQGAVSKCEYCKTENVFCRIVQAWEEPCLYSICAKCEAKQEKALADMNAQYVSDDDDFYTGD